jgi:hypothetical protein
MSLKNPVTPPGINPGTVRLVAQRLNHCATPDPDKSQVFTLNVMHLIGEAIPQAVCRRLLTTEAPVPSQVQALWDFVMENVSMRQVL